MRPALAAAALALLCACAGYTKGETLTGDGNGIPIGQGGTDAGDAGPDGGTDGGDAGPDGGCAASFNPAGYPADDNCFGFGTTTAFVTTATCNATISFGTTQVCTGVVSGSLNAFDGGCQALACTGPSIPGRITCTTGCQINICDAGELCGP